VQVATAHRAPRSPEHHALDGFPLAIDTASMLCVDKRTWVAVFSSLGEGINYDNFKSEVARYQGRAGAT
jgi:hypothetical protein